jgi:tetratricopeptide (TPR) repeat protein
MKTMPLGPWPHRLHGWFQHFFGRDGAAYAAYQEAFHHAPAAATAACLGYLAARLERLEEAEAWYGSAAALAPERGEHHFNLGYVRDRLGRPRQAIAAFDAALDLDPQLDRAWYGKGLAHAALGEHEAAATALEKAVELQPMNGIAYYHLGMAYHHAGRQQESERIARRLAAFEPRLARQLMQDGEHPQLLPLVAHLEA